MSEKGLQILARKNHLLDIKGQLLESCTNCLAGKHHKVSFQKSDKPKRRKHVLDSVHSDIFSMFEKSLPLKVHIILSLSLMITQEEYGYTC